MQTTSPDVAAWDDLRVLLAVQRAGSFLAAGHALGVATSTVSRRIAALERTTGRRLVHRTADGVTMEPAASALLALAEHVERALTLHARDEPVGAPSLAGTVRVSIGDGFERGVVRALAALRKAHPEIRVELVSEARVADLAKREADIGLRTATTRAAPLVVRALGALGFGLYASSELESHERLRGRRIGERELARLPCVGMDGALAALPAERWLRGSGARDFVLRTSSASALLDAVRAGIGVGVIADALAIEHPELVRLRTEREPPRAPAYLAMHRELRKVPRVMVVADTLTRAVRESPGVLPMRAR
ncbi:LysR family transcriptional regulator [Sandaracinus amylolyticus]|uniref:LysR family transcriptional regulator n=1 Tax=Sandaracinus amylolyticus TaxID=927083 RepID=UPI001F2F9EDF|nr:LysR family transcriptional regulator [Sandaracinus amylolyticus]UJR78319.1 LysR family transcriptional regulator [Sandaracinus amylolyticus]